MRLTVDTGVHQDLTSAQMQKLDDKLRTRIPQLKGWGYSPITAELTLDFSDTDDTALITKILNWLKQADGIKLKRFELMEMVREWLE